MRILHTSDWHLNDRLGRHERQPDLRARMAEIAAILKDEGVDLLLIAGDLFSDRHPRLSELRAALRDFQEVFRPFLRGGGTAVAIAGNHDNEDLFQLWRAMQDLTAPVTQSPVPPGRLYLVAEPMVLQVADRAGHIVQLAHLPYPTPTTHLRRDETFHSAEERNRLLRDSAVRSIAQQVQACASRPHHAVLVAHCHVRNSQLPHSLYRLEERDDVILDPGLIPAAFSYVALGHIHRAQEIDGAPHIRYSGSIERMDAAERGDEKGVVLCEIGLDGAGPPRTLPLDATPILDEEIAGPADVPRLAEAHPRPLRERAYLRYQLRCRAEDEQLLHREVRALFPRWYSCSVLRTDEPLPAVTVSGARLRDTAATIHSFVAESLREAPQREAVLARLRDLLEDVGGRP